MTLDTISSDSARTHDANACTAKPKTVKIDVGRHGVIGDHTATTIDSVKCHDHSGRHYQYVRCWNKTVNLWWEFNTTYPAPAAGTYSLRAHHNKPGEGEEDDGSAVTNGTLTVSVPPSAPDDK